MKLNENVSPAKVGIAGESGALSGTIVTARLESLYVASLTKCVPGYFKIRGSVQKKSLYYVLLGLTAQGCL